MVYQYVEKYEKIYFLLSAKDILSQFQCTASSDLVIVCDHKKVWFETQFPRGNGSGSGVIRASPANGNDAVATLSQRVG